MRGVERLAKAVSVTLGPKGRWVIVEQKYGPPRVTKDGVSVAESISDAGIEGLGIELVKQAASKTADKAGDGTTTATVLTYAMCKEGAKLIAAGANPVEIKRGMDLAASKIISILEDMTLPVKDLKEISQVASVSANGDEVIGNLIATVITEMGKDGAITVEEGRGFDTYQERTEGMSFDRGFISPNFITNTATQEAVLEDCLIFITDKKIGKIKEIVPVLQVAAASNSPLLIVAEDVEDEALTTMVVNRLRMGLRVCAVKAPGFGDRRKRSLENLAILTGGRVVSEELGDKLESLDLAEGVLGKARRVVVGKEKTVLVDGKGSKERIETRREQIRSELEEATSSYTKENLQAELGHFSGGVAVIYVGGATEVEMKERKDRIVDALEATKAAVAEGILPGGGTALIRAAQKLRKALPACQGDENLGIEIVLKALEAPLLQIADNAGKKSAVILQKVEGLKGHFGYNARTDKFEDLVVSGVIDPKKVVVMALRNAEAQASMILTTEATVTDLPEAGKQSSCCDDMCSMGG
ncbi:Heat shock protein 60 family chaperone GroEL [Candidatus Similichlamydia laticola]|uniref:60 kDa chaperonin n=1 Tax=Candidatus Similichlamydia laticola TaxID=2170265 RepID=A0A369KCY1_9BACT|nr:Heat shock protein 60 family chaperone GroEL [Candidatus Similichlamydia laticola]